MTQQAYDRFSMPNDIPDNEPPNGVAKALHDLPALIGDLPEIPPARRSGNSTPMRKGSSSPVSRSPDRSARRRNRPALRIRRCTACGGHARCFAGPGMRRCWWRGSRPKRCWPCARSRGWPKRSGITGRSWRPGGAIIRGCCWRIWRDWTGWRSGPILRRWRRISMQCWRGWNRAGIWRVWAWMRLRERRGMRGPGIMAQDSVTGGPCRAARDEYDKVAEEGEEIEDPYFARLDVMEAARPDNAPRPHMLAKGAVRRRRTGSSSCNCRRSRRGWQSGGRSPGRMGREGAALK